MSLRQEFLLSIKSFDTEEKLDLYFYRPLGFLIAKASLPLGVTPTQLTITGLLCGFVSAAFCVQTDSDAALSLACALLVLAGIFDSSDGQLERIGGKSTKLGLVLDGLCNNLVFAAAYISCTITLLPRWGMSIWPVALFAGICHFLQSSMLDYYNREYLYFGVGKRRHHWNPTEQECAREAACSNGRDKIFWRLMGPNFHTLLLIASMLGRRFERALRAERFA